MTNYQEGRDPRATAPEPGYPPQGPPPSQPQGESYSQSTAQFPGQAPPGYWEQQQGRYAGPRGGNRPHLKVRSTFLTTEFWTLVVVSVGILIAAAVTDEGADGQGFGAHDAWKFIAWLAVAYMISRGLTKLGGNRRDGGDPGNRI